MTTMPVAATLACGGCGHLRAPDDGFCAGCGARFEDDLAATAGTVPRVPPVPPDVPPGATPPPAPPAGPAPPPGAPGPGPWSDAAAALPSPSAVGRRATAAGWAGVALGVLLFTSASVALVAAGRHLDAVGPRAVPGSALPAPGGLPTVHFDDRLYDGATVVPGEPLGIRVAASNPTAATTDWVWLVVEWRPADLGADAAQSGRLVGCSPTPCTSWDETATGTTTVRWPGLPAGERATYEVTAVISGVDAGDVFHYRITTGSGASAASMTDARAWDLELDVEAPAE